MTTTEPFRIFVGTDETQLVAHQVLEYSIRKHASVPVDVIPMIDLPVPAPRDHENRARTGFSLYRFMIPELCGYHGRALYLDADMLVFGDVAELAMMPFGDAKVLCTFQHDPPEKWRNDPKFRRGPHAAVMVLDCDRLEWDAAEIVRGLDRGDYTYPQLVQELSILDADELSATIPPEWNHLERYEPGTTRNLHYTVVSTQPWKRPGNPLEGLWTSWYEEAMAAGAVEPGDVARGILAGDLRASLAAPLATAPGGSEVMAKALLELDDTKTRLLRAESRLRALESSSSWKIGSGLVRLLDAPRRVVRRSSA